MSQVGLPTPTKESSPWIRKVPSPGRFLFWNLFWWSVGGAALVAGVLYTEHVVKPVAEAGGTSYNPLVVFESQEAGKRVFGTAERMNILVLGLDYNYDEKGILYTTGARSDTMMVLSLSRQAEFLNVVSIPRDTVVYIGDGYGYDKINTAYTYGGAEQAIATVSDFLDIPIHRFITVRAYSAVAIVDALGGLPIDVEKDMDYDDNWGNLHIHLKKGPQVLNGEDAVGYARFRMDEEGDRGRIRRQQQVVRALGRKLKEPALLSRLPELARIAKENLDTDLKVLEMIDLANLYSSFDFSKMRSGTIVGDDAMDPNGISFIEPYAPENERTVRRLLKSLDWLSKDDLRIKILYRRAGSGVAYELSDRFYDAGFRGAVVEAADYDDPRFSEQTRIVWYQEIPRLKSVVSSVIPVAETRSGKPVDGQDNDLVILLGDGEVGGWNPLPQELVDHSSRSRSRDEGRRSRRNSGSGWHTQPAYSPPAYHSDPVETQDVPEEDVTLESYPRSMSNIEENEEQSGTDFDMPSFEEPDFSESQSVWSEPMEDQGGSDAPSLEYEEPPLPRPVEIDLDSSGPSEDFE